jgi:prepilin-type N-terminal cleavage/methylation domain-containing protein
MQAQLRVHMEQTKNTIHYSYNKNSRGFTLIELVVAILIFALGIVGIMKMHQASVQSNNFSMQFSQAMNIAEDRMDLLRGLGIDDANMSIGVHNPVTVTSMGVQYSISWTVSVTPFTYNAGRDVNLTIAWNEKAIPRNFVLNGTITQ